MSNRLKILVTGAGGQLGAEFRHLAGNFPSLEFHLFSREELSITDSHAIAEKFNEIKPDYCINTAAYTLVDRAEVEKEKAFKVNGDAVGYLALACHKISCKFIHISTDYVFAGDGSIPYTEDHTINPVNVYGASKAEGEKLAVQYNPDSYIIRTSWLYGREGNNFVRTMHRLMSERDKLGVVNDQWGCPTNAADLAEVIIKIILAKPSVMPGIYHFSNSGITTWYGFAMAIREFIDSSCAISPIDSASYPTPAKRPAYSVLDTSKISEALGIEIPDWKKSLELFLKS